MYRQRIYNSGRRRPPFGLAGFLIVVGVLFLLNNFDVLDLGYLFGVIWRSMLVLWGVSLMRGGPRVFGLIVTIVASILLIDHVGLLPDSWDLGKLWPVVLVGIGGWMWLGQRRRRRDGQGEIL